METLHLLYGNDHYEVSIRSFEIVRILRYWNGSSHRQEMDFDDLPEKVKEMVVLRIVENHTNET